jgi:hypothetical protein
MRQRRESALTVVNFVTAIHAANLTAVNDRSAP